MSTATRKQRERQQREAQILEVSRPMLLREGYHGLNMDRVAEALQYSKGTIYNHFSCKEEIIIALAIQTMEKRTALFERAAAFRGRPRERMDAVGLAAELFVRLYPEHFRVEHIIRNTSMWEKTSEKRRVVMRQCESHCVGIVGGLVRDAIAERDLQLPPEVAPADLVFGIWSMAYGAFSILTTSDQLPELGISDPFVAVRKNIMTMLDGYRWRPLSGEHDYQAVKQRIADEVFPDECRRAFG